MMQLWHVVRNITIIGTVCSCVVCVYCVADAEAAERSAETELVDRERRLPSPPPRYRSVPLPPPPAEWNNTGGIYYAYLVVKTWILI